MKDFKELTYEDCQVAADLLKEHGMDELAEVLESSYMQSLGKPIAIYGPRFIWRGVLVGVTPDTLTLRDVWQVKETGEGHHDDHDRPEDEVFYSDRQVFERISVTNAGPVNWAKDTGGRNA